MEIILAVIAAELLFVCWILRELLVEAQKNKTQPVNSISQAVKRAVIKATKGGLAYTEEEKPAEFVPLQWRASINEMELRDWAEKRFKEMEEEAKSSARR